eukprot:970512-Amorphochlora_amoeboformis.AAC.1
MLPGLDGEAYPLSWGAKRGLIHYLEELREALSTSSSSCSPPLRRILVLKTVDKAPLSSSRQYQGTKVVILLRNQRRPYSGTK